MRSNSYCNVSWYITPSFSFPFSFFPPVSTPSRYWSYYIHRKGYIRERIIWLSNHYMLITPFLEMFIVQAWRITLVVRCADHEGNIKWQDESTRPQKRESYEEEKNKGGSIGRNCCQQSLSVSMNTVRIYLHTQSCNKLIHSHAHNHTQNNRIKKERRQKTVLKPYGFADECLRHHRIFGKKFCV